MGNQLGLFLTPPDPVRITRGFRSLDVDPTPIAARTIDSETVEIEMDTGLVLHAGPEVTLIVERPFNRRDRRVGVREAAVSPGEPLSVRFLVNVSRKSTVTLQGELASVTAFMATPTISLLPLHQTLPLGIACAAFFDEAYFAAKKKHPTGKYKAAAKERGQSLDVESNARWMTTGSTDSIVVSHAGGAPPSLSYGAGDVASIGIPMELSVDVAYTGHRVEIRAESDALARRATLMEASLRSALGDRIGLGAIRYFTTYFTAHAAGDPHLFFKPAVLVATPLNVLTVVDGPDGEGLEGMRGVTESNWFHALPAVAEVISGQGRLTKGKQLVRARFIQRRWLSPRVVW